MLNEPEAIFVYGSLRRGELAHRQVAPSVSRVDRAYVAGFGLYVRDGLPFITEADGGCVQGELLTAPATQGIDDLRRRVREYEGGDLYTEQRVRARTEAGDEVDAWVYVGRGPSRGSPEPHDRQWSSADDPLFRSGLDGIFRIAKSHFENITPMPADMEGFWEAFLPIQGTYLTLCTVLERYTALVYGPGTEPGRRLGRLRDDPTAVDAVTAAEPPPIEVSDSRDPRERSRAPGPNSFDAWYRVRSNLSHRGKAAYTDFRLVERSIVGLHDALRRLLAEALPLSDAVRQRFAGDDRMLRPVYEERRGTRE